MSASAALRDHLDRTDTVHVITRRADDTEVSTPIWSVVVDDQPYIRSVEGPEGWWFRRAVARGEVAFEVHGKRIEADVELVEDATTISDVDAELERKYARQRSSVQSMMREPARQSTLRVVAREGAASRS